ISLYVLLVATASADKLQSNYLPPTSALSAGGSSSFLSVPRQSHSGFSSNSGNAFSHQSGYATSYAAPPSGPVPASFYNGPAVAYSSSGPPVAILRFNNKNNGDGSYIFEYQTENKISQQEEGQLQNAGSDQASAVVHGSYSYEAPDGQTITVTYIADEYGFRASGDHIPTPPPIPLAIQKSLEINSAISAVSSDGEYPSSSSFNRGTSSLQTQSDRRYLAPSFQATSGYRY
ncbi:hypothetical protein NQ315_005250, partial [Exocentrus adspersus]